MNQGVKKKSSQLNCRHKKGLVDAVQGLGVLVDDVLHALSIRIHFKIKALVKKINISEKQARFLLKELENMKLKPKKGRLKDLCRIETILERISDKGCR